MRASPGVFLVAIQFPSVAVLLWTGPWLAAPWIPLLLEATGGVLAVWSIATTGVFNVRATPELARDTVLVVRGPYRVLRHPMYTSLLLVPLSLLLTHFTVVRLAAAVLLLFDLLVKLHYEERLLAERFTAYAEYRTHTWHLVPFLY